MNTTCYDHRATGTKRLCQTCQRILVEKDIAKRTVKALTAAQFVLGVSNGEDTYSFPPYSPHVGFQAYVDSILDKMGETDEELLEVFTQEDHTRRVGWVWFVYGNDGWDVISDYSLNLEDVLKPVNDYADTLA